MHHFLYTLEPLSFEHPDHMTDAERRIARAHYAYLNRLADEGVVFSAGRTEGAELGIVVFSAESEAEATRIMEEDPAIKSGILRARLYPYRMALHRGPKE